MVSSVYMGVSQSEHTSMMEERGLSDMAAASKLPAMDYVAPPLFPDKSKTLVLWGLDDVLVKTPAAAEANLKAAYKARTIEAVQGMVKMKLSEEGIAMVGDMVDESYRDYRLPSRRVAEFFKLDERELMTETLSAVAYKDIALNPTAFGMGDQGVLNFFEASANSGISHAVVTNATYSFGMTRLHYAALDQYIKSVFGMDVYGPQNRTVLRKSDPEDAKTILHTILSEVPAERWGDVVVADHNMTFLAAAREMGLRTAIIDIKGNLDNQKGLADTYHTSPQCFFQKVLGIKDPGSRRESHIYAGIGGVTGESNFRPSLS